MHPVEIEALPPGSAASLMVGIIRDSETDEPVEGAVIVLQCTCLSGTRETQTDSQGGKRLADRPVPLHGQGARRLPAQRCTGCHHLSRSASRMGSAAELPTPITTFITTADRLRRTWIRSLGQPGRILVVDRELGVAIMLSVITFTALLGTLWLLTSVARPSDREEPAKYACVRG